MSMIKLKSLIPESITQSSWKELVGKDVVLTNAIKLMPRETRGINITVKVGEIVRVEAVPYLKQPNNVPVSYNGMLYTADTNEILTKTNIVDDKAKIAS
jgi:hypothetical protein